MFTANAKKVSAVICKALAELEMCLEICQIAFELTAGIRKIIQNTLNLKILMNGGDANDSDMED
jgi:hypothetical protein